MEFLGYYNKNDKGFIGFIGRLLNSTNKFELVCHGVNKEDVTVLWQTENITDTIVKSGVTINNFGYEKGSEDFIVLYKNKVLRKWGFYSTNKNETHNFKIELSKKGELLEMDFSLDERRQKILLRE